VVDSGMAEGRAARAATSRLLKNDSPNVLGG
jgi:hypothetical protein